ncbi:hypothetical protein [Paraburkholderia elongata]|uniref:Uncharacterized protein n=1 Tax=Paraburkholderia elongata TaxID=2675747 RepID=A0A972SNM6_9BURK|nr:hypothetical protein [Paraburkholderia elongata]NPT61392.1 hypothetical protein [Paraburkholderia elongata]
MPECIGRIRRLNGAAVSVQCRAGRRNHQRHDQGRGVKRRIEIAPAISPVFAQRAHRGGADRYRALFAALANHRQRPDRSRLRTLRRQRQITPQVLTPQVLTPGMRRLVAPQPGVAHQQDRRARGAPLPGFGLIPVPTRAVRATSAARIERGPQSRRAMKRK